MTLRPNYRAPASTLLHSEVAAVRWKLGLSGRATPAMEDAWHRLCFQDVQGRVRQSIAGHIASRLKAFLAKPESGLSDAVRNIKCLFYSRDFHGNGSNSQAPATPSSSRRAQAPEWVRLECCRRLGASDPGAGPFAPRDVWQVVIDLITQSELNDQVNDAIRSCIEDLAIARSGRRSPSSRNAYPPPVPVDQPPPLPNSVPANVAPVQESTEVPSPAAPNAPLRTEAAPTVPPSAVGAWQYLPIPNAEPDPHEESAARILTAGTLEVIGARVRGRKHKHEGTNCDDWFELRQEGGWTLIAVSDGAGSKRLSRLGARAACEAAVSVASDRLKAAGEPIRGIGVAHSEAIVEGFLGAIRAVSEVASARAGDVQWQAALGRKPDLADFSCTLLLVAQHSGVSQSAPNHVLAAQIGDGAIVLATPDLSLHVLGKPDSGEFGGETEFLTSRNVTGVDSVRARVRQWTGHSVALFAMTDGVADDYFPADPQCLELWLDLVINGILPLPSATGAVPSAGVTPAGVMTTLARAVGPQLTEQVELRSAAKLVEKSGHDVRFCLSSPNLLEDVRRLGQPLCPQSPASDKLRVWLDTYHVRGSFDDRTLVVLHPKPSERTS